MADKTYICNVCGSGVEATDSNGNPVCTTCVGISSDGRDVREATENELSGPWMCVYCKQQSEHPQMIHNAAERTHYDGCRGWD